MKAIVMTAPGKPDVLELREVPQPTIQNPSEILVKLHAAGVNPIDTKLRQRGTFYPDLMPAILGCDGAGEVVEVGTGVVKFRGGDRVYFCQGGLGSSAGNYAEYIVVDERFVAKMPGSLSFAEAAAAPLVLITAWEALYDRARLDAGQQVLIHAGAGGVGHVAIQLAKLKGASVATTVSSREKADLVQELGADLAIFYKESDFVSLALNWTGGQGVDVAFDTVGGELLGATFPAVKLYGDVVTILEPDPKTNWKVARNKNLRVSFELMLTPILQNIVSEQQAQAKILNQCARLIDAGKLTIQVNQTFPLEEAAQAHQLLETGSVSGKIVLLIG
ncbi:zinc-dependent alcohol dehydrogenase family protein [Merismopedia glauca]|uniref:Alcohol dehydrogenase n=1 Tax=Merismopedia glauca CCAP 1448/3 TaxID=1296344 RepID=A0A2T1C686_9CYAN|nr:zinc-dependent alcohol dehydrogenase family protein [Merismopedia glauca]PSB03647.1 alcohol dehydrogenase [Merismopedia glauca CCAP 1448/3]